MVMANQDIAPEIRRSASPASYLIKRCHTGESVDCAVQLMKNETLKITYSYWDGQGHRRIAMVKKGDTVKDFLQKVKEQLIPEFRELR